MAAVARLLGLAKFGVGAVTYAEPSDPVFGRRDMHTVRYTEMAPDRFKNFWKD